MIEIVFRGFDPPFQIGAQPKVLVDMAGSLCLERIDPENGHGTIRGHRAFPVRRAVDLQIDLFPGAVDCLIRFDIELQRMGRLAENKPFANRLPPEIEHGQMRYSFPQPVPIHQKACFTIFNRRSPRPFDRLAGIRNQINIRHRSSGLDINSKLVLPFA